MKTSAKFKEYIWLVNTISRARKISFAELQEKWLETEMSEGAELARSTFNRHKDAIEDIFGINIDCDRKDGYRYFIGNADVFTETRSLHRHCYDFEVQHTPRAVHPLRKGECLADVGEIPVTAAGFFGRLVTALQLCLAEFHGFLLRGSALVATMRKIHALTGILSMIIRSFALKIPIKFYGLAKFN